MSGGREGCGARKTKSDTCVENSTPCNRMRCRFNKGSMTLNLSLVASVNTEDFTNHKSQGSYPADGQNSSSRG